MSNDSKPKAERVKKSPEDLLIQRLKKLLGDEFAKMIILSLNDLNSIAETDRNPDYHRDTEKQKKVEKSEKKKIWTINAGVKEILYNMLDVIKTDLNEMTDLCDATTDAELLETILSHENDGEFSMIIEIIKANQKNNLQGIAPGGTKMSVTHAGGHFISQHYDTVLNHDNKSMISRFIDLEILKFLRLLSAGVASHLYEYPGSITINLITSSLIIIKRFVANIHPGFFQIVDSWKDAIEKALPERKSKKSETSEDNAADAKKPKAAKAKAEPEPAETPKPAKAASKKAAEVKKQNADEEEVAAKPKKPALSKAATKSKIKKGNETVELDDNLDV